MANQPANALRGGAQMGPFADEAVVYPIMGEKVRHAAKGAAGLCPAWAWDEVRSGGAPGLSG